MINMENISWEAGREGQSGRIFYSNILSTDDANKITKQLQKVGVRCDTLRINDEQQCLRIMNFYPDAEPFSFVDHHNIARFVKAVPGVRVAGFDVTAIALSLEKERDPAKKDEIRILYCSKNALKFRQKRVSVASVPDGHGGRKEIAFNLNASKSAQDFNEKSFKKVWEGKDSDIQVLGSLSRMPLDRQPDNLGEVNIVQRIKYKMHGL